MSHRLREPNYLCIGDMATWDILDAASLIQGVEPGQDFGPYDCPFGFIKSRRAAEDWIKEAVQAERIQTVTSVLGYALSTRVRPCDVLTLAKKEGATIPPPLRHLVNPHGVVVPVVQVPRNDPRRIDRERVQAAARAEWAAGSTKNIAQMVKDSTVQQAARKTGSGFYADKVIRRWIKDLCPLAVRIRGAPKKKGSLASRKFANAVVMA